MANEQVSLGQALRQIRETRGLSQGEVEDRCGVPKSYVSSVERGAVQSPGFDLVVRICQGLGVSVRDLAIEAGLEPAPDGYEAPRPDEAQAPATRADVAELRAAIERVERLVRGRGRRK